MRTIDRTHAVRNKRYRANRHRKLVESLGGKCVDCGATESLTCEHKFGREWSMKLCPLVRLKIMEQEAEQGLLEVLCRSCNSKRGRPGEPEDDSF